MSNDTAIDPSAARKRACLEAAIAACCGDRAFNYGAPENNFRRIGDLWNAWWNVRVPSTDDTAPFGPVDIAVMNILLKVARLANTPSHNDSWIDIAGYAACGADITRSGEQKQEGINSKLDKPLTEGVPIIGDTIKCLDCGSKDLTYFKVSGGYQCKNCRTF